MVLAEAQRGGERSARVAPLVASCVVESLLEPLARQAGEALGAVRGSTTVDAIVVASAAQRGDVVLTSDLRDLSALTSRFPGVDVIGV